jgi:hypothetical protein
LSPRSKKSISKNAQSQIKQGYGVYYFSNGDIYFGEFFNNKFHNNGTYIFNNDEYFEGIFSNGESVKGNYHYKNQDIYEG